MRVNVNERYEASERANERVTEKKRERERESKDRAWKRKKEVKDRKHLIESRHDIRDFLSKDVQSEKD